jgi:hypothetical protein
MTDEHASSFPVASDKGIVKGSQSLSILQINVRLLELRTATERGVVREWFSLPAYVSTPFLFLTRRSCKEFYISIHFVFIFPLFALVGGEK